jgi:transketolase
LGTSHHTTEDIGMLRTIPNLEICSPADPIEARDVTSYLCQSKKPAYLRLGKAGEAVLHHADKIIEGLSMICLKEGEEVCVMATGSILGDAKKQIENTNKNWGLYSVPYIKPLDLKTIELIAKKYNQIITLEEHQKSAGFGSSILEALYDLKENGRLNELPDVKRIAIPDMFIPNSGTQEFLRNKAGLFI